MPLHKVKGLRQFARVACLHANKRANGLSSHVRRNQEPDTRQGRTHEVLRTHHLRARKRLERREDMILGRVCQAIKE